MEPAKNMRTWVQDGIRAPYVSFFRILLYRFFLFDIDA